MEQAPSSFVHYFESFISALGACNHRRRFFSVQLFHGDIIINSSYPELLADIVVIKVETAFIMVEVVLVEAFI